MSLSIYFNKLLFIVSQLIISFFSNDTTLASRQQIPLFKSTWKNTFIVRASGSHVTFFYCPIRGYFLEVIHLRSLLDLDKDNKSAQCLLVLVWVSLSVIVGLNLNISTS